jgi:hypothetical protein
MPTTSVEFVLANADDRVMQSSFGAEDRPKMRTFRRVCHPSFPQCKENQFAGCDILRKLVADLSVRPPHTAGKVCPTTPCERCARDRQHRFLQSLPRPLASYSRWPACFPAPRARPSVFSSLTSLLICHVQADHDVRFEADGAGLTQANDAGNMQVYKLARSTRARRVSSASHVQCGG